jgi:hypothetical protein
MLPGWISPVIASPASSMMAGGASAKPLALGILSMMADTRNADRPTRRLWPRAIPRRSAISRPTAISPPEGRLPPGARSSLPARGQAESTPDSSASRLRPSGETSIARVVVLFDDGPIAFITVCSSVVASRWATDSSKSPPRSWRPLSAIARSIEEARLVTEAKPAIATARQIQSRPSPASPPRRSWIARRIGKFTASAARPPYARRVPPGRRQRHRG